MRTIKKIVTLIIVLVVGYYVYQHFLANKVSYDAGNENDGTYEDTGPISAENLPPIPSACEALAKKLGDAMYGAATHEISYTQKNRASRVFASCLSDEGFSDEEVEGTIAQIQKKTDRLRKMDGY